MRYFAFVPAWAIFLAGCHQGIEKVPNQASDSPAQVNVKKQTNRADFERSRSLWRESKITNYRMTVDVHRTGHAAPNGEFIITVREGVPQSIKRVNEPDVEILDGGIIFQYCDTLEDIFLYIEQAESEERNWNKREIEYDSKLGYPKKVNLDDALVMHDDLSFQVLQFEALE